VNLVACARLPTFLETRTWYRAVQPQFYQTSLDTAQTRLIPSRFSAGSASRPPFELLYLAEDPIVALFEVQALFGAATLPGGVVPHPRRVYVVLNVDVRLVSVADLTDVASQAALRTTAQELTGDWRGYQQRSQTTSVKQPVGLAPTQDLGATLFRVPGLEGFRTLSARLPYNEMLVVFPTKLQANSLVRFHDPVAGQPDLLLPKP
jgi:hypothetical protein